MTTAARALLLRGHPEFLCFAACIQAGRWDKAEKYNNSVIAGEVFPDSFGFCV